MTEMNRRDVFKTGGSILILGATAGVPAVALAQETVKLGLLHSLSGTIAIAEASLVDAEKLAIEEINASGGVMGPASRNAALQLVPDRAATMSALRATAQELGVIIVLAVLTSKTRCLPKKRASSSSVTRWPPS
mgnify:CR=1 FL=1